MQDVGIDIPEEGFRSGVHISHGMALFKSQWVPFGTSVDFRFFDVRAREGGEHFG